MTPRQIWSLIKQSMSSWGNDYAPSMGAALSYYTLFSIAPLLIIVIAVAGLFFGADAVRGVIFAQLQALMGDEGARAIQEMLTTASHPKTGAIATTISVFGLLIGATTVFNELQSDLDRIWRAPAREKQAGIWKLLRTRLLSFGLILGFAFLLTVSLVTSAALATLGKWWGAWFGAWEILGYVLDLVLNFGLLTLLFALIYKMIPRVHVSWHDVWIGAAVTALLFTVGKFLIGMYLGKSNVTSSFGAAGSMVIVMLWVYYSAQIFLLGAEFTWVYANAFGSRRNEPKPEAATRTDSAAAPTRSDSDLKAPPSENVCMPDVPSAAVFERERAAATVYAAHQLEPQDGLNRPHAAVPVAAPVSFARRNKPALAVAFAAAAAVALGVFMRGGLLQRGLRVFRRNARPIST
ncbi:MAG TPA: YihY/virulence factor BrkB family protein [Burkholderiales bacterium]|nr:YihY/virulence factor BrkB family protein [Burkholderiales bacterium]